MTEQLILLSDMVTGGLRILVCLLFLNLCNVQGALSENVLWKTEYGNKRCRSRRFLWHDVGESASAGDGSDKSVCAADHLLSAHKPDRRCIAAGMAGALGIAVFAHMTKIPEFYRMALEALWIAVCVGRLQGTPQKADARMNLFLGIFFEIAVFLWQFLAAAGMGILFRSQEYPDSSTGIGQAALWMVHVLLAALFFYFSRKPDLAGEKAFRAVSGAALAGFIAVITLSEQSILEIPEDTLSMWTILSMVLLMLIPIYNLKRRYEMEKELEQLKAEQAELLERDYTTLNHAYAVNAKLFHDFHNHIGVLRRFLAHEKYEEAVQYLDELQAPVREMTDTVWTGDETLDYLINSKVSMAEEAGIQMQTEIEFPRNTNIRGVDLCAILGNLLDNALEAAGKVPSPKQRSIRLTIRRINQMLVIKVENSFHTVPVQEGGELKTTKAEDGLHGWGIKSARTAAERYDGMVQSTYSEDIFCVVVTLCF